MTTPLPPELARTIEEGGHVLSYQQQLQLAEHEAGLLGMTLAEAAAHATDGTLPRTPIGYELADLLTHLNPAAPRTQER